MIINNQPLYVLLNTEIQGRLTPIVASSTKVLIYSITFSLRRVALPVSYTCCLRFWKFVKVNKNFSPHPLFKDGLKIIIVYSSPFENLKILKS